ncbi:MAG TPA: formimidoylglutamate deiminase [Acidothermaceae bacterium]|jgi:formiminoglutamate deiminase
MPSWWCENAWLPPGRVAARVLITVDDGRVTEVKEGIDPPPTAQRLTGLVIPGLANTHSHAFHRALRGRTQAGRGDFWTWREQMYAVATRLDPDNYLALARVTYTEMALAGITCVGEFHYVHHQSGGVPYSDPNAMGAALIEGAAQVGVRLTLLDACYVAGGIGESLTPPQRRFSDGDAVAWAARVDELSDAAHVRIGAAIHSVRAVPSDQLGDVADWARKRAVPFHFHLSEQRAENDACLDRYGVTPTRLLADSGALGAAAVAVHATHLTAGDIALLASSSTGVCLCPTTERDLGDGIGPAGALAAAGVALSVGSDGQSVIDMFEEARGIELDERLATYSRGTFVAGALLDATTVAGHRGLGWADAGQLAVGMRGDLVAVDLASRRTAGGGATAETVVYAASAADVTDVVVDGNVVVKDREHVRLGDIGATLQAAIGAVVR